MDLRAVREEALEETTRFFIDTQGVVPDQDSEEWEAEYRRRFELARQRHAGRAAAAPHPPAAPAPPPEDGGPALGGAPAEKRWAAALRAARLREIEDKALRHWLAGAWTAARDWIDTRELAPPAFRRRVEAQYAEHRRKAEAEAEARAAEKQAQASAAQSWEQRLAAAGITAAGLVELIDVSPRTAAAPIAAKLAEVEAGGRVLRVFETARPGVLLVKEKNGTQRLEYAIERDEGLVVDLRRFDLRDEAGG
jgi:hypothetical protein